MDIRKIPVIGYIGRMIWAIVKLPKHIESLYQCMGTQEQVVESLRQAQEELRLVQEKLRQKEICLDQIRAELQNMTFAIEKNNNKEEEHFSQNQRDIEELRVWNSDRMAEIRNLYDLNVDPEYLIKLNGLLSGQPLIWGYKERLHISELAAVYTCRFNTNSGEIRIGDYTFAGLNVSILAGSHEKNLRGLARREAEYRANCDINIGNGVWLASNATILGPCTIGDDAIVAAGAVVIPGTVIPPGTIYGGVPARQIGSIDFVKEDDLSNIHLKEAVQRTDGVLFLNGWSDRISKIVNNESRIGHALVSESADLLTNKNTCKFYFQKKTDGAGKLYLKTDQEEKREISLGAKEGLIEIPICNEKDSKDALQRVKISVDSNAKGIFLSTVK